LNIAWVCLGFQFSARPFCQLSQYVDLSGVIMTVLRCVSMQSMTMHTCANIVACFGKTQDTQLVDHACTHCMYCAAHIPHQFAVNLPIQTCNMPSSSRCLCSLCPTAHLEFGPCRRAKQCFSQGSWPKPTGAFCT